jgi:hypothetical protein
MRERVYEAPRGFEIDTVMLRCVHCEVIIDKGEASRHKLEHGIENSRAQGSGRRQCSCPYGGVDPQCVKHAPYRRRFTRAR